VSDQGEHALHEARQHLKAAQRLDAVMRAKDDLLTFMRLTMPDPDDMEDSERSQYKITPQARLLCDVMQKVERRELKRVAISIGPQVGKSQVITRAGPAWLCGRNPALKLMVGAYNQTFAEEFGGDVRTIMQSPAYKQVFPNTLLKTGGTAKDLLETTLGAKMAFVGVGGSGTGKPAEVFIVDDPIRSDADAQSELYREGVWNWFTKVVNSRIRGNSAIIVVHTRWHEDDLIGRLCDPEHPERNKKYKDIADRWTYLNIPTLIQEEDLAQALSLKLEVPTDPYIVKHLGAKPMASLWPEEFPLDMLAEQKALDARGFSALRQGKPTPDDGVYFRESHIIPYHSPAEIPKDLRMYGASDHAVSTKQTADSTVLGCVGIDSSGDIWVMDDVVIRRMETDVTVDELLLQFLTHKPQLWWMESEMISKSFGPFLKKLMHEKRIYTTLDPVIPSKDKSTRARAIQGRMSHGRVHFPVYASWWPEAKAQLLRFPHATHDDFVDWLSHIGAGLLKEIPASAPSKPSRVIAVGSPAWILAQTRLKASKDGARKASAGW
jgi:predicted phage terminase large subunit-like protein